MLNHGDQKLWLQRFNPRAGSPFFLKSPMKSFQFQAISSPRLHPSCPVLGGGRRQHNRHGDGPADQVIAGAIQYRPGNSDQDRRRRFGGPIEKNELFYFADYQATRTNQGIPTGRISVPTLAERQGNFQGVSRNLTGGVSGPYLANLLSQDLGYTAIANEPYYTTGCNSSAPCVSPNATIPRSAWSSPAQHLLPYIPLLNDGPATFSTGADGEKVRDDKGSFRVDGNTARLGLLTAYYFI
jgi:hypothetical protein